ncbi:MerR family transcriptional regulator [Humidesulfovibrio sp.]
MQSYTHRDLAQALGVSETTIKSYRAKFPSFLPVAREGKPVRLHPEALDVCRRIRDLFADGLSISQTTRTLQLEFKEYPRNRRLSTSKISAAQTAAGTAAAPGESALGQRIEALTQAQNQARGRMELLELEVRNLATMEAASKALIAELLAELRAARASLPPTLDGAHLAGTSSGPASGQPPAQPSPQANHFAQASQQAEAAEHLAAHSSPPMPPPAQAVQPSGAKELFAATTATSAQDSRAHATPAPAGGIDTAASLADPAKDGPASGAGPTVLTARKIVTLHGPGGPVASYALGREPKPEPPFPDLPAPAAAFLDLPAVIRSDRGDFLGLPGGQSVRRLVEVLTPEGATPPAWFQESPESWTCAIPLGRAQNRELLFERTTTPRGNLVGLIRRMRINETEATPTQLQEIFRQLRDQLT